MVVPKEQNQSSTVDTRLANVLNNEGSVTEKTNFGDRLKQSADVLAQTLTGQNRLQPAYAMDGDRYSYPTKNIGSETTTPLRSDMAAAHRAGNEIHLDGDGIRFNGDITSPADRSQFRQEVRNGLDDRYRSDKSSDTIELRTSDGDTVTINNKALKKLVSGNFDKVVRFAETIDDLPDLLKFSELVKSEADAKGKHNFSDKWDKYVAERVRLSDNNLYDISHKITKNRDNNRVLYYQRQDRSPYRPESSSDLIPARASKLNISQNPEKVNVSFETPTERNSKYDKEVKRYYNKYGDDFYEKMPDNLKEHYDSMLDAQPRDKDGRYTDPITGEKWTDEDAKSDQESGFAKNTSKNSNFSEETRQALKNDPINYKAATNEERLARANEILSTKKSTILPNMVLQGILLKRHLMY